MDSRHHKLPSPQLLNALSAIALVGVLIIFALTMVIFIKPEVSINPFPPPTLPVALVLPTRLPATPSIPPPILASPTESPIETITYPTNQMTKTPGVTFVVWQPSSTSMLLVPITGTPPNPFTPTETFTSSYLFQLQSKPAALSAYLFDSGRENCDWMGVAGQVYDQQGRPVTGMLVQMGGRLEQNQLNLTTITGTAMNFGPGGFEFMLSDHPIESAGSLWLQLVDQAYVPLSEKVYIDTSADCDLNLVILNFKQVR